MGLGTTQIQTIEKILSEAEPKELGAKLRAELPGVLVTGCDEEDMGNEHPFRSTPGVHVHLVDGSSHCWTITSDPEKATSILLARRRKAA